MGFPFCEPKNLSIDGALFVTTPLRIALAVSAAFGDLDASVDRLYQATQWPPLR